MKNFNGIMTVLITPFDKNDEVDYKGLESNIEWLLEQGVHSLLTLGSTGEYASLEDEERYKVAECVVKAARGRVPVLVGTTCETQKRAIRFSKHAESIGASGVMLTPPPYCKPDMEQVYRYYKDVNDAINIPIIVYNNPWTTGVDINEKMLIKLFNELENVQYLKDSTGTLQRARDVKEHASSEVKILCGWEDLAYECFLIGAQGWICVASNVLPKLCVELYEKTAVQKDIDGGREVYNKLLPFLRHLENSGKLVQVVKTAANILGLAGGYMRGPRLPLSKDEEEEVRQMLIDMKIINN